MRHFVGYDRFEGWEPYRLLGELYTVVRLYVNFFQPSLKLVAKKRVEGKVRKQYDQAQTPYQRVLAAEVLTADAIAALKTVYEALDPVALLR